MERKPHTETDYFTARTVFFYQFEDYEVNFTFYDHWGGITVIIGIGRSNQFCRYREMTVNDFMRMTREDMLRMIGSCK